jgi:hypothetical protein
MDERKEWIQQVREEAAELNRRRPLTEAEEARFQQLLNVLERDIRYNGPMGLPTNWEYFEADGLNDNEEN